MRVTPRDRPYEERRYSDKRKRVARDQPNPPQDFAALVIDDFALKTKTAPAQCATSFVEPHFGRSDSRIERLQLAPFIGPG